MTAKPIRSVSAWMLGFLMIVNLYLIPSLEQTPRATDLIGACLGLWLVWRLTTRGVRLDSLAALLLLSAIPVTWGLNAYVVDDVSTVLFSLRWLLAIPLGYVLFLVARDPRLREHLIWGMLWGCLVNVIVLSVQYSGALELTQGLGLAAQDTTISYVDTEFRAPGMEGHPNSSAAILSLAVPLSLYLYYVHGARIWVVGLGLALLLAGSQFTETRSAVLVSIVTVATMLLVRGNPWRSLRLVALLACAGLPLLVFVGPPGGWERWLDRDRIEANSGERLLSNAGALRLSWENPLGLGVESGTQALYLETGVEATHNAFLQIGLTYGPLLAAAVFFVLFFFALQVFAGSRTVLTLEATLALQMFGLCFFEEHFNSRMFVILLIWIVVASGPLWSGYFKARRPASVSNAPRQTSS